MYTGERNNVATNPTNQPAQVAGTGEQPTTPEVEVAPVTKDDHIRGNPNADIVIVEFSDYDCPFCKRFHEETMLQVMNEYGTDGEVAWVYRHFPLEQLHPNAPKIAEAAECVGKLGGNEAFWTFSDLVFGERSINQATDMTALPGYATQAGVSASEFSSCLESGEFTEKVASDIQAAMKAGARGTPYSILIAGDRQVPINGAQPYGNVKATIDAVLESL